MDVTRYTRDEPYWANLLRGDSGDLRDRVGDRFFVQAMKGVITRIDKRKWGNGADFIRVSFELEGGIFSMTDLCPTYRNFSRWEKLLKVGNVLDGLDTIKLSKRTGVDADSRPRLVGTRQPEPKQAELF
jgi:hypothetical protein